MPIGNFIWKTGTIDGQIQRILKSKSIRFYHDHFGTLYADIFGTADYRKISFSLVNPDTELYHVFAM